MTGNSDSSARLVGKIGNQVPPSTHMDGLAVSQDLACFCECCTLAPMDNAKLFPLIQAADLEQHPVWETILDDEADDPSAFPVQPLPVINLDSRFVATRVRLANERLVWAMLFNVDLTDSRKTEHLIQLRIEHNEEWFWLARYWDIDAESNGPDALARFLGVAADEVFPIHYDLTGLAAGLPSVIKGQIPKEPRERLPRDEIIRLCVP